jgi:hypothetical protein
VKRPPVYLVVIALNLVALVALAFIYPHLMVSPGPLVAGHAELATDCFACHAPWRGAAPSLCIDCHAAADIGLRTTKGVPILTKGTVKASFHQDLIEQDCMACHSDHQGPKLTLRGRKSFSHTLLKVEARNRCSSCHAAPKDKLHPGLKVECGECHKTEAWKPATFDHNKYFVLDRDHDATCVTCHTGNDYSRYTCYGCHEHTPQNVREEHLEEGIRDFENCVECHRNAQDEPRRPGGRGKRERD